MVVGLSLGARRGLALAAAHPDRVAGVVALAPASIEHNWFDLASIRADYPGFVAFFHSRVLTDPHSTKRFEDAVAWSLETTADVMVDYFTAQAGRTPEQARELCGAGRCPVLVVHGTDDRVLPHAIGAAVAGWTGGALVTVPGAGHSLAGRDPVKVNHLIRDFARSVTGGPSPSLSWTPARHRNRRALFLSSPIGLGHTRRDLAIADELRKRRPDVEIEAGRPSTPSPWSWRPRASGCTRRPGGWRASPRTSRARAASTTCRCSRRCAPWTRSCSRTSTCSTT